MTELVSVVIIFLNAGPFIGEAIDSVRDQSHPNWELLLVDDGSRDASTAIAQAAAQADPRIRYLTHPGHVNLGTSVSRNLGLAQARGGYVLYLDADDILMPAALGRLAAILTEQPELGLAFGSALWWFWAAEFADKRDHLQPYREWADQVVAPPRFLSAMVHTEDFHPANGSTMLRRSALVAAGGFDTEFRGMYEDTVMLAKMLLAWPAAIISDVLSAYRMHPASQCHIALAEGSYHLHGPNQARERYLRWLQAYIRQQGVHNRRLSLAVQRELWLYDRPRLHRVVEGRFGRTAIRTARRLAGRRHADAAGPPPPAPTPAPEALAVGALQELEAFYGRRQRPDDAAAVRARWQVRLQAGGVS